MRSAKTAAMGLAVWAMMAASPAAAIPAGPAKFAGADASPSIIEIRGGFKYRGRHHGGFGWRSFHRGFGHRGFHKRGFHRGFGHGFGRSKFPHHGFKKGFRYGGLRHGGKFHHHGVGKGFRFHVK